MFEIREHKDLFKQIKQCQQRIRLYQDLKSKNRSDFQNYVCDRKLLELRNEQKDLSLKLDIAYAKYDKFWQGKLKKSKDGGITKIDIDKAKSVPFSRLLEFNKYGFTLCPFHGDTKPSMKWYKEDNIVHCFGCGIHLDTIEYMRKRYDLSFKEAVKSLLRQS